MLQRRLLPFLLIFCVLFAQQAALVHAASHWQEESQSSGQDLQHPKYADKHVCASCIAFAALASAIPSSPQAFGVALSRPLSLPFFGVTALPTGWHAYNPRAPPTLLV
ncbi:hypothetical protein Q9Q94_13955 [Uliginosibacterium sp. 31-16]|uniref:hypothetical protein n=1 Tax=Uliginosibacterium sp. 31-16 TaxID=3068315 RepID=UPI00273E62A9|nr:hypothetical protein [Uliginosibacterium sp. 31-16]MDP5240644.1 hypothetical protein [Uliginosibacterium sp. 31-16]